MQTKKISISVLGAGSWGTTIAVMLARKPELKVSLWSAFEEHGRSLQKHRVNKEYLNIRLPDSLEVVLALEKALAGAEIVVLALPVKYLRKLMVQIKQAGSVYKKRTFVNVAKGMEIRSLKMVSGLAQEILGNIRYAVLSGPNIAMEILRKMPSVAVAASRNKRTAQFVQEIFSSFRFRVYTSNDVAGVELAGALKNVIAIACGISDGLGFGTNTKAALVSRGLAEMIRLGKVIGAQAFTFSGVAGIGDLVTTCFSQYSRNRFVGQEIAKGKMLKTISCSMKMVAEGVDSVKAAHRLSRKYRVSMPIIEQVYKVLYRRKLPAQAVRDLMMREKKIESD